MKHVVFALLVSLTLSLSASYAWDEPLPADFLVTSKALDMQMFFKVKQPDFIVKYPHQKKINRLQYFSDRECQLLWFTDNGQVSRNDEISSKKQFFFYQWEAVKNDSGYLVEEIDAHERNIFNFREVSYLSVVCSHKNHPGSFTVEEVEKQLDGVIEFRRNNSVMKGRARPWYRSFLGRDLPSVQVNQGS